MSGPAGGYVGYATTSYDEKNKIPVIGFDMGGTSTDVSRFGGEYEHVFETELAGVTIQAPQLDITTVAAGNIYILLIIFAGGGSMLFFKAGMFVVGPESAGAHPGPVCYRKGGPLTITDANLFLGKLLPEYFPKIFGKTEDLPLDFEGTKAAFEAITVEINKYLLSQNKPSMTPEEVAHGFVTVANETMCRPIRNITVAKGYDTRDHTLACFGGAGAQHACAIAEALGMKKVLVHRYGGILSAYGLGLADVVAEEQEPCSKPYKADNLPYFKQRLTHLSNLAKERLSKEGFKNDSVEIIEYLNLRYYGTDYAIMTNLPSNSNGDYVAEFEKKYKREYGFVITGREVIVDDIRVRAIGKTSSIQVSKIDGSKKTPTAISFANAYFEGGRVKTPVYDLNQMGHGDQVNGMKTIAMFSNFL